MRWLLLVVPGAWPGAWGCAAAPSKPTPPTPPAVAVESDEGACQRLCTREASCGADTKDCSASCTADARRMKPGFITRYATCFIGELDKHCGKLDDKMREAAHLRCFDATLAFFPRDLQNQRDMAEPVCNRGERCMGLGKLGRDACMQATLDPREADVKLGQRLVDALRPARVKEFRTCVDAAPCAKLEAHDDAVDQCYARTIAGSL